jgi:hypothetical protein
MKNLRKYTEVDLGCELASFYREELFATGVTRRCMSVSYDSEYVRFTIKLYREEVSVTVPVDQCILMRNNSGRKWDHVIWIDRKYFMREIKYA